ncbi:CBS domain-containing protein [Pseudahrensia aquimaris]|uniref:CBS domain-containing protein n=1 Tax=Pseudahrensia aquimaris TaxID=744461 RepID=A0ABW3FFF2_9HYPH
MRIIDRIEFKSKPKPLTTHQDTLVSEAVAEMSAKNYGSVVVNGDDGKMVGLFTERDVMKRIVNAGLDAKKTKIADVMTRDVRTAGPEDSVHDWLRIMSNERFRRLPVIDENGDVIAIMTQGDFVSYTWPDLLAQANEALNKATPKYFQAYLLIGAAMLYSLVLVWFLT